LGITNAKKNERMNEPNYIFHRVQRAHANHAEWTPMLALVMLYVDSTSPSTISTVCMAVGTFGCLMHKVGMLMNIVKPNTTKVIGMTLFYIAFFILSVQMIGIAMGRRTLDKQIY